MQRFYLKLFFWIGHIILNYFVCQGVICRVICIQNTLEEPPLAALLKRVCATIFPAFFLVFTKFPHFFIFLKIG